MIHRMILTPRSRPAIMANIAATPDGCTVAVGPPPKSRDQEERFHAICGEIARQAKHVGSKWDAETWKRLIVELWSRDNSEPGHSRVIPALDGAGIVQLGIQTRKLSKERYSALIEFAQMWCAENGVELSR